MRLNMRMLVGFLFIIGVLVIFITIMGEASGKTIIVDKDGNGDYEKIQYAIDNATNGDTIKVWGGTYFENVVVNVTVSLVGNGSEETVINGEGVGDVVKITSDWVNMSGFMVTESGGSPFSGIMVESENNHIFMNNCSNNGQGIRLESSNESIIENNKCYSNSRTGIYIRQSNNCMIINNLCVSNDWNGIFLFSSSECIIENNTCEKNDIYGIYLPSSSYNDLMNNTCENNHMHGIHLAYSSHINLTNNKCSNDYHGIYLTVSNNCTITNNIFSNNNYYGIILFNSADNCSIYGNLITGNEKGIYVELSSQGNIAHYNIIYNNTDFSIDVAGSNEYTIDARNNWWGYTSGPHHSKNNPDGKGDNITDDVLFDPWFTDPPGTLKPTTRIDSISPNPALDTDTIHFKGNGETPEDKIIRYVWHSSRDGAIYNGTESEFFTGSLSVGEHTIYLKVENTTGRWSNEDFYSLVVHVKPTAQIDYISPNPALETSNINFKGHGTDNGSIIQYFWFSSLDGEIYNGTNTIFILSNLSLGEHNITLRVQDNYGEWSDEVNMTLMVTEKPLAGIESIAPNPALNTDTVTFMSSQWDCRCEDDIERYVWWSSINGELYNGSDDQFNYTGLSIGNHTIHLTTQDKYGFWSNEVNTTLIVLAETEVQTKEVIISRLTSHVNDVVFITIILENTGNRTARNIEIHYYIDDVNQLFKLIETLESGRESEDIFIFSGDQIKSFFLEFKILENGVILDSTDQHELIVCGCGDCYPVLILNHPVDKSEMNTLKFTGATISDFSVQKVEYNIEGTDDWFVANGTTNWSVTIDIKHLKSGTYSFRFHAYDGQCYSLAKSTTIEIENEEEDGEGSSGGGFIPGFEALSIVTGITFITIVENWKRRKL